MPETAVVDRPLEIGERVRYRSLVWEVAEVRERSVTLFGREPANRGRTVQPLSGYELIQRVTPPVLTYRVGERTWNDADWRAMHDAYRLTLAQGRGSLGTAAWGRLVLEPYQLVPLQRIEQLPEPRLLIADDMGLGKTSEAGLILSRLLQRRRADRVLVVCRARPEPERWRDELLEKFGVDFEVINDGADYARLRRTVPAHLNLYAAIPRLIVSMHFAAQAERLPDLDRPGLRWDVVIVDEAHHVADRGGDTRLSTLGRVVARAAGALLLLTATPHDGKVESFASLVELVDPFAVADRGQLQPRLVRPLIVRRLKSHVVRAGGERFVEPVVQVIDVEPDRLAAERHLERGVRGYARQLRQQQRLLETRGERGAAAGFGFLETLLRKRLASSVRACRLTLEARLAGTPLDGGSIDEDGDEPPLPDLPEVTRLPNGRSEREIIDDLLRRCDRIADGTEGKLAVLARLVTDLVRRREKVVVFTEYRATLSAIVDLLSRHGLTEGSSLLTYHGSTPKRDEVRRRFLGDDTVMVLAATDAASEGINLQDSCNHLVHVEVPWNPNRYEQRNGRIDRYGQRATPHITLLVARGYVEQRAAEVVMSKLTQIARDLGSVSNVAPFANALSLDAYLATVAGDEEDAPDVDAVADEVSARCDAAFADRTGGVPTELLTGERFEDSDLRTVESELAEAAAFAPSFDDVRLFLTRFLLQEGGAVEPRAGEPGAWRVRLSDSLQAAMGIDAIDRAAFDRSLALREANQPRDRRIAFLSPGHPVVAAALRRARAWALMPGFASRVSYRLVGAATLPSICFTFAVRFLDGRGETVEERFEVVAVLPDGTASRQSSADRAAFSVAAEAGEPRVTEIHTLTVTVPQLFDRLRDAAVAEAELRARARAADLEREQARIATDALVRLGAWKERAESRIEGRFGGGAQLSIAVDVELTDLVDLIRGLPAGAVRVDRELLARLSPDTLAPPMLVNPRDGELLSRVYRRFPRFGEVMSGWSAQFGREIDSSGDRELFRARTWLDGQGAQRAGELRYLLDGREYIPLLEGRNVWQLVYGFTDAKLWMAIADAEELLAPNPDLGGLRSNATLRTVWRDVSRFICERSMIAAIAPADTASKDKLPYVRAGSISERDMVLLAALWTSFAFDWQLRIQGINAMKFGPLRAQPVPSPDVLRPLLPLSLAALQPEWLRHQSADACSTVAAMLEWWRARAEIDAAVFGIYGFSLEDAAYVLSTFPLLDRQQPSLPGEDLSTVTRDLVLAATAAHLGEPDPELGDLFRRIGRRLMGGDDHASDRAHRALALGAIPYMAEPQADQARQWAEDEEDDADADAGDGGAGEE